MEHWQFLIQRQGDRSWHPLESSNREIFEGRYRVLARSNRPNTDVEVRVIHSSTQEVPPKRRIQKRSRRTNSEGLMAVVPFTYFQAGVWELQCSGDVMSDILGKSWQYSVSLQVLPQPRIGDGENIESNSPVTLNTRNYVKSLNPIQQPLTPATRNITAETANTTDLLIPTGEDTVIEQPVSPAWLKDEAIALTPATESITAETVNTTDLLTHTVEDTVIDQPVSPVWLKDEAIALTPATEDITAETANTTDLLTPTVEDTVIDQPVSPVWLKGETAEQILQNLIDLALPGSEPLLEEEIVEDAATTPFSPPLSLILDREIYVAHWGQSLTINGQVELKARENPEDDTPSPTNIYALELGIELRSPVTSKILTQKRQPLPDEVLPLTIRHSIEIPAECESKLILVDISLHGALSDVGEVIVLASQSFTITADVAELLAISAATQSSTANPSDDETASVKPPFKDLEPSVGLDLALFNLVKSNKKEQPLAFQPSVNKSLPPLVNKRSLKKSPTSRSPELPNLPPLPMSAIAISDSVLEEEGKGGAIVVATETANLENASVQDSTITPIDLEMLVIKNRPVSIATLNLPYLKPLTALSSGQGRVSNSVPNTLENQLVNSETGDLVTDGYEHIPELVTDDAQPDQEPVAEVAPPSPELIDQSVAEVASPLSSQLIIEGNPYSSPVIRKWLRSQGYMIPEEIHVPDKEDDTHVPPRQIISKNQLPLPAPPPPPPPPPENIKPLLDVETTTSADWEVTQPENRETAPTDLKAENEVKQVSAPRRPIPPPPPPHPAKKSPAWLAQEIVVDDTEIEPEVEVVSSSFELEEQPESDVSLFPGRTVAINEPLPIPQLYVPEGELIAGNYVKIRIKLPELPPQVAVKLWVEDYQTRWLLEDPHLLKNLQPNPEGGLEVITQLQVPFGCIEIRIEAIALDMVTQQESHKITIVRTVIPPDLPTLQLDELGI